MAYYDPFQPLFEAKRLEIQKTIMNLQQRLLRRKQIDLQIEKQIIEQESIHKRKRSQSLNNWFTFDKSPAEIHLEDRLKMLGQLDLRQHLKFNQVTALQKQAESLDYFARLRASQRQRNLINQQITLQKERQRYAIINNKPYDDKFYPFDESGETIARKYIDGTRALEFEEQLKRSASKDHLMGDRKVIFSKNNQQHEEGSQQPQKDHSTVKKYLSSTFKNNDHYFSNKFLKSEADPTPIKQIYGSSSNYSSTAGKGKEFFKVKNQEKQLKEIQERQSVDQSAILQSKGIKRSRTKSTLPTNQYIKMHFEPNEPEPKTCPKSSLKNSRQMQGRYRSSKSLRYLASKNPLPDYSEPIQKRIRRQIQNRTRLSQQSKEVLQIFYAKDVSSYLLTIYEKEEKFRKQLKEKICKIPAVERKYDVAPVLE